MVAEVIVDISSSEIDRVFDYGVGAGGAETGCRVMVPFGNRRVEGYVIGLKNHSGCSPEKLRDIIEVLDGGPVINAELMELMRFMTGRYHLRIVDALRLFIPAQLRGGRVKKLEKQFVSISPEFIDRDVSTFIKPSSRAQLEVFNYIAENDTVEAAEVNRVCSAAALRNLIARGVVLSCGRESLRTPYGSIIEDCPRNQLTDGQRNAANAMTTLADTTFLLFGVTGSGKTEVYMSCIEDALNKGKTAIMLVPEISLTPQVVKRFRSRFRDEVALLHSGLSAGERYDEWRRLLTGQARVAVGARSAIFAPLENLGVIIIDEEHDTSYTSDANPRYITAEVAEFRRRFNGCNLVLGSATPSVDSFHKAESGVYKLVELPDRINRRELPKMEIVDMCRETADGNSGALSRKLTDALRECMARREQAIIFINRRGYSSYVMCRSCGYIAKCERCDVSLVYHREELKDVLKCHYCGNRYEVPEICPMCGGPHLKRGFVGTQQIEELLRGMFPDVGILRMDNDTTQNKESHLRILGDFGAGKAKILVGTQMIAKGHDFPDVTLVGIVDADMSLHFADYRSTERTFQLITQVSGRAGRDLKPGKVILQTYSPRHYVYRFASSGDYRGFYDKEINLREVTRFPPFSTIVRVLVTAEKEAAAATALKGMFAEVKALCAGRKEVYYLAYMWSPVKKIKNLCRMQLIVRMGEEIKEEILRGVYDAADRHSGRGVSAFVEINPNNLS